MKKVGKVLAIIVLVLAVIALGSSIVVTQEDEYKLVRQFGKIDRVITEPGLSFKIPFLETTTVLPKKMLHYDLAESDVITADKKTMITDSYVLWEITSPLDFAKTLNSSVANAENRIDAVVYNAIKNVIGTIEQNEVITSRDGELTEQIMAAVGTSMDQYGIKILTVETKRFDLPADNKTSVYERMISERDKIAATYIAEGDAEAQIIINATDKEIAIMLAEATAQAEQLVAAGEAEYMQILSDAYSSEEKAEFYSFVRSLDAAKVSLSGDQNTLILPKDSPIAEIFLTK
ncbi:MAG: protease modulator HflC [Lachnospiraceae bacterium]|nr:protease modulator HflC [Lachnospiraceae bacterium]